LLSCPWNPGAPHHGSLVTTLTPQSQHISSSEAMADHLNCFCPSGEINLSLRPGTTLRTLTLSPLPAQAPPPPPIRHSPTPTCQALPCTPSCGRCLNRTDRHDWRRFPAAAPTTRGSAAPEGTRTLQHSALEPTCPPPPPAETGGAARTGDCWLE
jgi:hypothetical protein